MVNGKWLNGKLCYPPLAGFKKRCTFAARDYPASRQNSALRVILLFYTHVEDCLLKALAAVPVSAGAAEVKRHVL